MPRILNFLLLLSTMIFVITADANPSKSFFNGSKKITLLEKNGTEIFIGTINFSHKKQIITYKLHLEHQLFTGYFLSMKEMKCLEGPGLWCHLAYPYKSPHIIKKQNRINIALRIVSLAFFSPSYHSILPL